MSAVPAPRPAARPSDWRGEIAGAFAATAAMLPFVLSFGFIVYGVLGDAAAQIGLTASLVAVVIGGAVVLLAGRARLPAGSPSASASLILGGAVLALLRDGAFDPRQPMALTTLLAATGATVVGSGLLMIVLGLLGAGRLVRYVPQPVLAGFMNGVAILIVVSQVPPLLGLPGGRWATEGFSSLAAWQGPALVVAIGTAALMAAIGRGFPRLPAPLAAMVLAGVAVGLWQALGAPGGTAAALLRIGDVDVALPHAGTLAPWWDAAAFERLWPHARTLATTAVILALIGSLESVLNLAAVDQLTDERTPPDRELVAVGLANVASGALGGLPLVYLRLRAAATWNGGGHGPRALWVGTLLLVLVFTLALSLVARLSTAVVAGVVVMLAWSLVDRWTRQLVRRWWRGDRSAALHGNLAVVALVGLATLAWGFVAGVGAGVVVSVVLFVRAMNRQLVRARWLATQLPSRRVHAPADEALLAPRRERIEVIELEGALFFGSAERLIDEAERLPPGLTDLIVDLRRVSTIDASGAMALAQLVQRVSRQGVILRLSGVQPDDPRGQALASHGVALSAADGGSARGVLRSHPDLDRAIEACEFDVLMSEASVRARGGMALTECHLYAGLDAREAAVLTALLRQRRLAAGERLFAQGDPGLALYVLTAGSVSVVDAVRGQRFASFSPGMCFGETAVLDGGGRTADAVADEPSIVHELSVQACTELERTEPALAAKVYRNLATHLSQRLRAAAAGWRHAAS